MVLGSASGAFADYEAPSIDLTVTPTTLAGGETFTGTATSNQDCTWSITYAGPSSTAQPIEGSGGSISFSFTTDPVETQQTDPVTAVCSYDDGAPKVAAIQQLTRSVDVTVTAGDTIINPPGGGTNGGGGGGDGLPNTGGPSYWLAAAGVVLTALGAGAVIRSRRPARV